MTVPKSNIIVVGAGLMGSAIAKKLRENGWKNISILDNNRERLTTAAQGVKKHKCNVFDEKNLKKILKKYSFCIISLPNRKADYTVMRACAELGIDVVDILEEYHLHPDAEYQTAEGKKERQALKKLGKYIHDTAVKNGVRIIDGMGFAPGLSNVVAKNGFNQLNVVNSAVVRVGGIPQEKFGNNYPFHYSTSWSLRHVLREYITRTLILRNGKVLTVDAMSDHENFTLNLFGKQLALECFVTPGMPSYIFTQKKRVKNFCEKTIRWPGHWQDIQLLKSLGMFKENPQKNGKIPLQELEEILSAKWQPKHDDFGLSVMWISIKGRKKGMAAILNYYLCDNGNKEYSAMARATAFPAVVAVEFLMQNIITRSGIMAPEEVITGKIYKLFLSKLEKDGIMIKKKISYG